jgi:alkylhydroperoxidase family enzyme
MAYVRKVPHEEATGILKEQFDNGLKRAGRVFQILAIQSLTPEALECTMLFYERVMLGKGPLRRWVRELLATVVSRANGCNY